MIKRKRIRKLNPYRTVLPTSDTVYVTVPSPENDKLYTWGFPESAVDGSTILPSVVGPVSRFNAEGKALVRRDLDMETAYRTVEWHWTEWHGKDKIEKSDFKDVPYKRYPRAFIAPPSLEFVLTHSTDGESIILSQPISGWKEDESSLIHAINLALEHFGYCVVVDDKKEQIFPPRMERLAWTILPKGEYPFERLREVLENVINRTSPGKRTFIEKRLERLNSFSPDYYAVGEAGFSGYVVMAYPKRNLYILESLVYGNATYVLNQDWTKISKMSKAEILSGKLHRGRIIHRVNWFAKVTKVFEE